MRLKATRPTALTLAALLAAAGPAAHAGTITFADLQRAGAVGQFRPASEVRLGAAPQGGGAAVVQGVQGPQTGSAPDAQPQQIQQPGGTVGGGGVTSASGPDATLSQGGGQVETIDLGDVTGTVCDCGEVPISIPKAAAAFPWWTLAGIPLVCVSGICFGDDDETPPNNPPGPTPTPPPPNPVPEPATLLLFGTGLLAAGAGARRRHGRKQLAAAAAADAEEV